MTASLKTLHAMLERLRDDARERGMVLLEKHYQTECIRASLRRLRESVNPSHGAGKAPPDRRNKGT